MLVVALGRPSAAGEIHSKAGTSAFPFLKINMGARAMAMGGAFTGLADDACALYYNPAGIAALPGKRFIGGYHNYVAEIQSGFLGAVFPLAGGHAVAVHADYLNYGEFIQTDTTGARTGTFSGSDMYLAVSYGRRLSHNFRLGATGKFIYEKIHDYSATGVALDLGAKWVDDRERTAAGVMIQNLGTQLSSLGSDKDPLPLTVRGGASYKPRSIPIVASADLILPRDNRLEAALGMEYYELKPLYVRAGYSTFGSQYRTEDSDDKWSGITLGVGFDYRSLHLAYAFAPAAELGDMHRITVTGGF
jgi:hypothetical protein